jgi:hypothetical protein
VVLTDNARKPTDRFVHGTLGTKLTVGLLSMSFSFCLFFFNRYINFYLIIELCICVFIC